MHTLSIDVGASHLKAAVLDEQGAMVTDRVRVPTPKEMDPERLLCELTELVEPLSGYGRVSVGFPGVVLHGRVYSAPLLAPGSFRRFDLASALGERLGCPVRVLNDAAMQGLGVIEGNGVEMVITLGSGLGSALFLDGELGMQMHLVQSRIRPAPPGGDFGEQALKQIGREAWSARVKELIVTLRFVTNFDWLYIGGGNSDKLAFQPEDDVRIMDNVHGILGGVRLWEGDRFA
ncbi:MAG TPA: ROK family protein [Longimicrobiaceae bacterium]|nr:ROK family protein [Longimicrobiaceae bacterium]